MPARIAIATTTDRHDDHERQRDPVDEQWHALRADEIGKSQPRLDQQRDGDPEEDAGNQRQQDRRRVLHGRQRLRLPAGHAERTQVGEVAGAAGQPT